jgi:hypothetical protein
MTAIAALAFVVGMTFRAGPAAAAQSDGSGEVTMSGELKQWHKVTLTLDGPWARESDDEPNPFTDYRLTVTFCHESGSPQYVVPGYFAADGDAANSPGDAGTKWRAHLSPDKTGRWSYQVSFVQEKHAALDPSIAGKPLARYDGKTGSFEIAATDKTGRDFRGEGTRRQQYGTAFLVKHEDRFFLFNESGDLLLARLTPQGYQEISRFHVLEPTGHSFGRPVVWSHPAFARRCLFARNDKELVCVDLRASE